jgi:RHS repeat-associated protein
MSIRLGETTLSDLAVTEQSPTLRRRGLRRRPLAARLVWVALLAVGWICWALPVQAEEASPDSAISENTGVARFRIPIEVPPGPGGLAPKIALTYSSHRGDGPYGVGWDLDLGEIACSARFGVPDYASCPAYELDGQRLTRDGTSNAYHPYVETFQKIEFLGGAQGWQVINPDGTTFRFGTSPDSRIQAGPSVAKWLLSEIEDPFGNQIFISYDASDPGTRYPIRMTYGAGATKSSGKRSVEFVFGEDRPDPIHDFAGGIERVLTKRLTDIRVESYGNLVRRYAFGYSLSGVSYSTGRTRLSWVQQFGSDCTGDISRCTGLPRQEYEYTDPNDSGSLEPSSKFDVDPNYVIPFVGNAHLGRPPVRIADVDGDGLPDLIKGGLFVGGSGLATVELNTGSGFMEDAAWTAALRSVSVDRPRADFVQIAPSASAPGQATFPNAGIHTASYSTTTALVGAAPPANPNRPMPLASTDAKSALAPGVDLPGWIEAIGRLFFTDVDGDGRADILVSIRLSGVDRVLDGQGNPIPPVRVPGRTVTMVYRNSGDPTVGWIAAPDLALGLPPFGEVLFESSYATEARHPYDLDDYVSWILGFENDDACGSRGLRGWSWIASADPSQSDHYGEDVCIDLVNLDPVFTDFNGDGFLDLMVLELEDPEAMYRGYPHYEGENMAPLPSNNGVSHAWIQVPDAASGTPRWERAPRYDLPSVDIAPELENPPFAHSGLGRVPQRPGLQHGTQSCGGVALLPFGFCSPLEYNRTFGVEFQDLNRDGLTDVIWSLYHYPGEGVPSNADPEFPLISQGVLLNTGTGWCASTPEMAAQVESLCADASMFYPPSSSYPTTPWAPSGFGFYRYKPPGSRSGVLTDLNSDGWLDYLQLQADKNFPGAAAWLFDPAGASASPPDVWKRDDRYDVPIDFGLIGDSVLDGVSFSVIDVNGDGAVDVVGDQIRTGLLGIPSTVEYHDEAFVSNSRYSDLIRLVRNGRGGQISIAYTSPITQRDLAPSGLEEQAAIHAAETGETLSASSDDVVRWTSAPVVSELRTAGPNRKPDPTSPVAGFGPPVVYRYAHPRFCLEARTDLGFRIVEKTRRGGEVATSSFYQVHGRAGRTSRVLVSEGGLDLHLYEEDWEIQPQVPARIPGTIDDPRVHVGRLAEVRSMNLYAGGEPGALTRRMISYDDDYGYDFVERIVVERPTGTLVELRRPISDPGASIFGLVAERKVFDHDTATFADLDFLKHTATVYESGRPTLLEKWVKARSETGPGAVESRTMAYDAFGNLTKRIVHGPDGDRITDFCSDGDSLGGEDASWCPDFGQDSHSVRVGVMDALGGIETFRPDPGTGAIVETSSAYTDEPSTRTSLDVHGRPLETFVSDGTSWLRTARTDYDDLARPPVIERFRYPEAGAQDAEAIWSATVSDGFGGVWKEIRETPTGFVGTLSHRDPGARTMRKSLPVSCGGDSRCTGFIGETEPAVLETRVDAMGRTIRSNTPLGFSIVEYFPITKNAGPGPTGMSFDGILEKNGKGDLVQKAMDGERLAWVEECGNTVPSDATDLTGTGCGGPDLTRTDYVYEATGELGAIHDARSVSPYDDPEHVLRRHYDTLGRVVRIEDPALAGAGETLTTYDAYGNIATLTNARQQQRVREYDTLDRLTKISTPANETDYIVSYRSNERQSSGDASDDYRRTLVYDALGRVRREQLAVRNAYGFFQSFYTDTEYDLLGRVTQVIHPAKHYEAGDWVDTIVRYEYDRGFLQQICELGEAPDCDSASTKYVSSATYDSLGRPSTLTLPGGVRTLEYDPATQRLARHAFTSSSYQYERSYVAFDGIGNVLSITGSETGPDALDMNESYVYDQRSRIRRWTKEGKTVDYAYDDLGNLVLHADEVQIYDDATRPHAIQRRGDPSSPITYHYDDDGNVVSILGGSAPQYFRYDSANRTVCIGTSSGECGKRVVYDIAGKRVADYASGRFNAYVGKSFLYEDTQVEARANVEIMLDGKRIALERFNPQLRGATAGIAILELPWPWIAGGVLCLGGWLLVRGGRRGAFVLVRARPARATLALGISGTLLLPSVAMAGGGATGARAPGYYWEITDPLGTGMVMFDAEGRRVRHQSFTPFGRVHAEAGAKLRTIFAGHRRDEDSGDYYMQARWYDPGAGRFLSTDPLLGIGMPQSQNPYSYVQNNPINWNDPSGRWYTPWSGPSGRPFIFEMYGLGWVNATTTTTTIIDKRDGSVYLTSSETTYEGSVAGGSDGLSQAELAAIGSHGSSRAGTRADERRPGHVYITGHRVGRVGPYHLAVEYDDGKRRPTTLSAGDRGGELESEVNRPLDTPSNNITMGTVMPPDGSSPGAYFAALLAADSRYCDCLDYDLFPGALPGDGYNSNSYVAGLIEATGGSTVVDLGRFYGGGTPLPTSSFGGVQP